MTALCSFCICVVCGGGGGGCKTWGRGMIGQIVCYIFAVARIGEG